MKVERRKTLDRPTTRGGRNAPREKRKAESGGTGREHTHKWLHPLQPAAAAISFSSVVAQYAGSPPPPPLFAPLSPSFPFVRSASLLFFSPPAAVAWRRQEKRRRRRWRVLLLLSQKIVNRHERRRRGKSAGGFFAPFPLSLSAPFSPFSRVAYQVRLCE